ncbi:MAG: helix-hairpin-helix domain-containing protein [Bacillota bacterium]
MQTGAEISTGSPNPFAAPVARNGSTAVNAGAGASIGAKVNVNTADSAALDTLPGVGPATAQKIIEYRTANGRFTSVEEVIKLRAVSLFIDSAWSSRPVPAGLK